MDTTIIKATGDSLSALTSALTKYDEHLDFRTIIKSEKETLVEIAPKSKDDHTVSYSVWDGAWINYRATSTFEVTDKQAVEVVKLASMINNEILCGAFACSVPDKDQRLHVIYSNTIVADDFQFSANQVGNFNFASDSQLEHWLPLLKTVATTTQTSDQIWKRFLAEVETSDFGLRRLCPFRLLEGLRM